MVTARFASIIPFRNRYAERLRCNANDHTCTSDQKLLAKMFAASRIPARLLPVFALLFIMSVVFLGVTFMEQGYFPRSYPIFVPEKLVYHPNLESNYKCPASLNSEEREKLPVLRALVAFYSVYQMRPYLGQLKWCMRSLLEMMKTEPTSWRTDLILYVEDTQVPDLANLGCSEIPRQTVDEPFRCVLVKHVKVSNRTISINASEHDRELNEQLSDYSYAESIIPMAEHPEAFLNYDLVIKSDLDVFLTPGFSKWLPPNCTFVTGNGGYNTDYNMVKLERLARLNNVYFNSTIRNIGSTWMGPGPLIAKVAQRTVYWMIHLSKYEFTPLMRNVSWWSGAQLWPDWHYGVLGMYGSHLAVNEVLQGGNLYPYEKFDLDHPTTSTANCTEDGPLHLHTYQTADYFSKYLFDNGEYFTNHSLPESLNSTVCRDYAGYIAGDSARMQSSLLSSELLKAKLKGRGKKGGPGWKKRGSWSVNVSSLLPQVIENGLLQPI